MVGDLDQGATADPEEAARRSPPTSWSTYCLHYHVGHGSTRGQSVFKCHSRAGTHGGLDLVDGVALGVAPGLVDLEYPDPVLCFGGHVCLPLRDRECKTALGPIHMV